MRTQIDIVDVLSGLLQTEQANVFHFLTDADPYIHPAAAELRRPLRDIIDATLAREGELASLIIDLGSTPFPPAVTPEFQYFAFLSIDFLAPKLVEAKQHSINRYSAALEAIGLSDPPAATLLMSHLDQHKRELAELQTILGRLASIKGPLAAMPDAAHAP
jgi:hypothetical protein